MSTPEKVIKPGEEFPPGVEVLVEIEKCPEGVQNPFKKVKKQNNFLFYYYIII
jgi:hypothetical protein